MKDYSVRVTSHVDLVFLILFLGHRLIRRRHHCQGVVVKDLLLRATTTPLFQAGALIVTGIAVNGGKLDLLLLLFIFIILFILLVVSFPIIIYDDCFFSLLDFHYNHLE